MEPIEGFRRTESNDTADAFGLAEIFGKDEDTEETPISRRDQWKALRAQVVRPVTARMADGSLPNPLKALTCFGGSSDDE
jgi:hypothetical protein